jgi:hypothetical protein
LAETALTVNDETNTFRGAARLARLSGSAWHGEAKRCDCRMAARCMASAIDRCRWPAVYAPILSESAAACAKHWKRQRKPHGNQTQVKPGTDRHRGIPASFRIIKISIKKFFLAFPPVNRLLFPTGN